MIRITSAALLLGIGLSGTAQAQGETAQETVAKFLRLEKKSEIRGFYRETLDPELSTLFSDEFLCLIHSASDLRERESKQNPNEKPPYVEGRMFMPNAWDPVVSTKIVAAKPVQGQPARSQVTVKVDYGAGYQYQSHYLVEGGHIVDVDAGGTCAFCQGGSLRDDIYKTLDVYHDPAGARCKALAK